MPDGRVQLPRAAHRFTLLVAGLVWLGMVGFGAFVIISVLTRGSAAGTQRVGQLVAGVANVAGGIALLSATFQDWRKGVRLNRNPRAMFGVACILMAALALLVLR